MGNGETASGLDSFRTKITVWNVFTSGCVLAVIIAAFLVITGRIGLDRVDREVLAIGHNALRSSHPENFWDQFASSLQTVMGEERAQQWFITVRDRRSGEVVAESNPAPEGFLADATAWTARQVPSTRPVMTPERVNRLARSHLEVLMEFGAELGPGRLAQLKEDVLLMVELDMDGREIENFVRRSLREAGLSPRRPGLPGTRRSGAGLGRRLHPEPVEFAIASFGGGEYRMGYMANEEVHMVLAAPLATMNAENRRYRILSLVGFICALGLLAVGGRILAGRALRPVEDLAQTMNRITARDLDQRVGHVQADPEFQDLVVGINGMLERLERGFKQASRFSADAAHELNTPLAVLQGEIENQLHKAEEGSPQQLAFSNLLEEVQRLKAVTHKLLLLAKADAGTLPIDQQEVWFSDILAAAMEDAEVLAGDLFLESEIEPGLTVLGDETLLRQVVNNLITNAIKYNCAGGYIRIRLDSDERTVRMHVRNPGENLEQLDTEKLFTRFYRADASRQREGFSAGLGLSLSREIVLAHEGSLEVSALSAEEICFTLVLPRPPGVSQA